MKSDRLKYQYTIEMTARVNVIALSEEQAIKMAPEQLKAEIKSAEFDCEIVDSVEYDPHGGDSIED